MSVKLDNLDDVFKKLATLEKAASLEVIRKARKDMRALMRSLISPVKTITPKKTGKAKSSIKIKSRSRRGVSTVKLIWDVPYSNFINFKKNQSSYRFATDFWIKEKDKIDLKGSKIVKDSFEEVFKKHGIKIKK